ncbi:hypothetical protein J2P12_04325 [Candidatus Bathyarchaeota archaeon]|nr:hypothetical protein [Candidatus Bathyarchaeota archaeon]
MDAEKYSSDRGFVATMVHDGRDGNYDEKHSKQSSYPVDQVVSGND